MAEGAVYPRAREGTATTAVGSVYRSKTMTMTSPTTCTTLDALRVGTIMRLAAGQSSRLLETGTRLSPPLSEEEEQQDLDSAREG